MNFVGYIISFMFGGIVGTIIICILVTSNSADIQPEELHTDNVNIE